MRYAITLDTGLRLIAQRAAVPAHHALVAPTLLRSEILAALHRDVAAGACDRAEARARLDHMRALKIRLLGDRVLQATAWDMADRLGWDDTRPAEYLAVAHLQADALVTLDTGLARALEGIVPLALWEALFD